MELATNLLYYGDNLEILRKYIPDSTIDLIYLDPPFNSQRSYNILYKESDRWSEAQVKAFEDTWHWTEATERASSLRVPMHRDVAIPRPVWEIAPLRSQ